MSSNYEKSVKGATKVKLAPPKSKYISHILQATHTGENGVGEVFRTLQFRLRDSTWTIAFKALIVVHLMIRDGEPNITLQYLGQSSPRKVLAVNTYTDVQTQGRNIRNYSRYLVERATAYEKTKWDYVGASPGRLKKLPLENGLLYQTEWVQNQVTACLKCGNFFKDDNDNKNEDANEISLTAFRMLTMDLLALFAAMNEGTIAILEKYFEMSKFDAERALIIYKEFVRQTDKVVSFLSMARRYEHVTRLEIPSIKHAPTNLDNSLEEYLHDKDFEINRRQYLAQQEAKRNGGGSSASKVFGNGAGATKQTAFPDAKPAQAAPGALQARGPAPDLIDFFGSIEQNQQPMATSAAQLQQQQQQQQPPQQSFNPFAQQASFTGPQNNVATQPQFQPQQAVYSSTQQFQAPQQQFQAPQQQFQAPQQQFQAPQQQQQQTGFGQFSQPAQQLQPQFTGAGFGGFTRQEQQPSMPQAPQQPDYSAFHSGVQQQPQFGQQPQQLQPQATGSNPFRQSMLPQASAQQGMAFGGGSPQSPSSSQTGRNPFAFPQNAGISAQPPSQQLVPQRTGTNPFAREPPQQSLSPPMPLQPNPTGSTNPFRQSQFINQQTGQGWQNHQQGTMGGLEQMQTTPVFPRPGQPQQQQSSPWG